VRKYLTTLFIALSFLVSEAHTFWHNTRDVQNWIICRYVPMELHWNIKYAGDQVVWILIAAALLTYIPNRVNKTSARIFLIWTIIDTLLYFINYKQGPYGLAYFGLAGLWLVLYYRKPN
jgi:hypothetical protein